MTEIDRIGIVGGGQLGRMLTEPALEMGFQVQVVEAAENCPAAQVGADQIIAPITDPEALRELAENNDVVTWEIEHFPASILAALEGDGHDIQPSPYTLAMIQDKLSQKQTLANAGIPVAPFVGNLEAARTMLGGGPYMLKHRTGGYDGRSNLYVETLDDPRIADFTADKDVYVEQILTFEKEIAVIAARDRRGNVTTYPTVETIHEDSICHMVFSPAEINQETEDQAQEITREVMKLLNGAGVFAIEMFVVNGKVLVNEIAPRVHNSGHLTIDANDTSQFEQHIRAISGMSLGSTYMRYSAAGMINILGRSEGPLITDGAKEIERDPFSHVHFYGKTPKVQRKIGHITIVGSERKELGQRLLSARNKLKL